MSVDGAHSLIISLAHGIVEPLRHPVPKDERYGRTDRHPRYHQGQ